MHKRNKRKQPPKLNISDIPMHKPQLRIAEDIGVKVIAHLPPPDEGVEPKGSEIRTKKRVWDGISIGKLRASYTPRGGVAR